MVWTESRWTLLDNCFFSFFFFFNAQLLLQLTKIVLMLLYLKKIESAKNIIILAHPTISIYSSIYCWPNLMGWTRNPPELHTTQQITFLRFWSWTWENLNHFFSPEFEPLTLPKNINDKKRNLEPSVRQ